MKRYFDTIFEEVSVKSLSLFTPSTHSSKMGHGEVGKPGLGSIARWDDVQRVEAFKNTPCISITSIKGYYLCSMKGETGRELSSCIM